MADADHLLRIVHAPLHAPTATPAQVKRALDLEGCSVGFTEAYPFTPYLRRRLSWRIAVGHSETSLRGPGDVPVMVRRHHKPVERWAIATCPPAEPLKLAPERWMTGFAYEHPLGTPEHIAVHPHPIMAPSATMSMRRGYRDTMEALERAVMVSLSKRRLPVVTGDLNLTRSSSLPFSPRHVFERLGMTTWNVGVDWIAWHKHLVPVATRTITDNGQDHPWLVIDFEGWRR